MLSNCKLLRRPIGEAVQLYRKTWVLRRVYAPEPTQPGCIQRNPEEHQDLMKYEVVEYENLRPAGPIKVILLQDVEASFPGSKFGILLLKAGVGGQFDVLEVDRRLARHDLLLTHKAAYASPFNLMYYGRMKEQMKEELAKRVRIPYDYLVIGRELMNRVVPLLVSLENPWNLNKQIVKTSLRQEGIEMVDDMIFLGSTDIKGPNIEIEARLVRFYVVVCNQYIVPMIGKICHISSDESKQVLYPETQRMPSEEEMKKHNLAKEEPYFSQHPDILEDFDVVGFMTQKIEDKDT